MAEPSRRLRLAVLASGSGRTLENLVERARAGSLPADVACVVTSTSRAYAISRARRLGLPWRVLRPRDYPTDSAFAESVFGEVEEHAADVVLLAGYAVKLPLVDRWRDRVMNIHPALLPAFGGRGYYGHHVHEAVLRAGVKVTGCTVHFVDDEYDHGPIILQRTVPVTFEDTAGDIAARVFEVEKSAYPEAIELYAGGRLRVIGGRVMVT